MVPLQHVMSGMGTGDGADDNNSQLDLYHSSFGGLTTILL